MEALTLSASISWGSSWRSCDFVRVKLVAGHDGRTILIQYAYERVSPKSTRGSTLPTLDLGDSTTDTLSSPLVQFGKILEERHSILPRTSHELIPEIYSASGMYLADP